MNSEQQKTETKAVMERAALPDSKVTAGCDASERALMAINAWFGENVRNSPIARCTEAYNHLVKSLPDLGERIKEAIE